MGNPDEFEAVTADGLLKPSPLPSPDSEDEWNRRELKHKGGKKDGKKNGSCGSGKKQTQCGKGKKAQCTPFECKNGNLVGNGFDYSGNVAQTEDGRTCKKWTDVVDRYGQKYAAKEYCFGSKEKK